MTGTERTGMDVGGETVGTVDLVAMTHAGLSTVQGLFSHSLFFP